ncbi:MAG: hypothetical protein R6X22_07000 [Gemmatimonadota bacterium]
MSDEKERGTIETRSGTWEWEVKTVRSWPKSNATGRRLRFADPANAVNTMSLALEPDGGELAEGSIQDLSRTPHRRRFQDRSGTLWIAHPVNEGRTRGGEPVRRVSLHSLDHRPKVVDLPPGRTLGDLKNAELIELL